MKVIDIMKNGAELLGLTSDLQLLETVTEENHNEILTNRNVAKMFRLLEYSLQEICTNYIPVCYEQTISTQNKEILISSLTNCLKVLKVYLNNESVSFKIINRKIVVETDGEYTIKYTTYPTIHSMFEELDFLNNLSPDIVVNSFCAYYSLSVGMFDHFKAFHEEYIETAESLKELKMFDLPSRRWE